MNSTFKNLVLVNAIAIVLMACEKDNAIVAPPAEHAEEVITDITLTFTNVHDVSDVVTATAKDPDGEGSEELKTLNQINLDANKTYTLTIEAWNKLEHPAVNISEEIEEEGDEHQIFYAFSNDIFSSPTGNGNIDNATDPINYNDKDKNGLPLGLSTNWITGSTVSGKIFKIRLQHQPDIKSATSGANNGDTDFNIDFVLNIK